MRNIPMLKKRTLDAQLSLPVERELRERLMKLKNTHSMDHLEWIRRMIRDALPGVEAELEKNNTA